MRLGLFLFSGLQCLHGDLFDFGQLMEVAGPRALMKVKAAAPAEAEGRTSAEVSGGTEADEAEPASAEDEAKKPRKRRSTARRKPK